MKKLSSSIRYYFNKNLWIIYILGFILSLIGSFQVYHGKFDSFFKEFSVIVISVLKLFLFSPTEGFLKSQPLAYELAVWIAPIGTVLATFSIFKKFYTAVRLQLLHLSRKHIIVMGLNDYSLIFMRNFINSSLKGRILCIVPENIEIKKIEKLHKIGILTCSLDYLSAISKENLRTAAEFKFSSVKTVLCFDDEPQNYGHIKALSKLINTGKDTVDVYMCIKNKRIQNIIQHEMDKILPFDIHYFNIFDLISHDLVNNKKFKLYSVKGLKKDWNSFTLNSIEDISKLIGNAHILLIGFSEFGRAFLETAANQSVINVHENMDMTVVDLKAETLLNEYRATVRNLDSIADMDIINGDILHNSIQKQLRRIHSERPFTSVVFATKNTLDNLVFLDLMNDCLKNVNIALYCENIQEISPLIKAVKDRYSSMTVFGDLSAILNPKTVINELLDSEAKKINASYNYLSASVFNHEPPLETVIEQWNRLSNIKKESNRNQFMHQNIKKDILIKITELDGYPDTVQGLIEFWKGRIENLPIPEQVDIIERDPFMNYMCGLEHKRWNNFYYMKNFIYSETKDEINRTHNCLVDNWSQFLKGPHRNTIIYDFLSVLNIR